MLFRIPWISEQLGVFFSRDDFSSYLNLISIFDRSIDYYYTIAVINRISNEPYIYNYRDAQDPDTGIF